MFWFLTNCPELQTMASWLPLQGAIGRTPRIIPEATDNRPTEYVWKKCWVSKKYPLGQSASKRWGRCAKNINGMALRPAKNYAFPTSEKAHFERDGFEKNTVKQDAAIIAME